MSGRSQDLSVPPPPTTPTSSMIRPTLALLAGLGVTALIVGPGVIIATLAMLRGVADPRTFQPSTGNLLVHLAINAVGAYAGGLTAARITVGRSFYTVFLLALVLFMSAMVVVLRGGESPARPQWYLVAQAVAVLLFSLLGGYVERRCQRRIGPG
jgi:uncharacterized membrane protein